MSANMEYTSNAGLTMDNNFAFTISPPKSQIMHHLVQGKLYQEPRITRKGQSLRALDNLTYLSSKLSRVARIAAEVHNRIAKVSAAFGRLSDCREA